MLGITLSLLSAFFIGISTYLQKCSMKRIKKFSLKRLAMKRIWQFSLILGAAGLVLYMVALRYESLSTVQPISSIAIVVPVALGWIFLREKIGDKWIHIILIISGVILLSL